MNKNRARKYLVLGVNGQDGSYLAEQLLLGGCEVIGIGRLHNRSVDETLARVIRGEQD